MVVYGLFLIFSLDMIVPNTLEFFSLISVFTQGPPTINGRSTLIRENVMKEDSGLYRCRAENVAGQQSMIFTLLVRGEPRSIKLMYIRCIGLNIKVV